MANKDADSGRLADTLAWMRAHEWWVVAGFALLAFLMGLAGAWLHFRAEGMTAQLHDLAYLSLRLFGLDYDLEGPDGLPYAPSNWLLQSARFLAPGVLAYGLFRLIFLAVRDMFSLFSISDWKDHAVICGAGERGKRLALTLVEQDHRVVMMEKDEENENLLELREAGIKVVIGSATDPLHQKEARLAQASLVAAVLPNPQSNVEISIEAAKVMRQYRRINPDAGEASIHAHVPRELAEVFENEPPFSNSTDGVQCRFFDHHATAARTLALDTIKRLVPGFLDKPRAPRILIAGNERFPASFAAQILPLLQLPNCGVPEIEIVSDDIDVIRKRLPVAHPQLNLVANLQLEQMERGQILSCDSRGRCGEWFRQPHDIVVIAFNDDFDSLKFARSIQQLCSGNGAPATEVIVGLRPTSNLMRLQSESDKPTTRYGRLVDLIELGSSSQVVFDQTIDRGARSAHENYLGSISGDESYGQSESHRPWDTLAEEFKNSNRRLVDHNQIKQVILKADRSNDMIEALSEAEHRSWTAERIVGGWRHHQVRDDAKRLHPDIVPYGDLSEKAKDKDRKNVRAVLAPTES